MALLATVPAAAAPPSVAHCTRGEVPGDAVQPTEDQRQQMLGLGFGYFLIPVIWRRYCGLEDATDIAYLAHAIAEAGCTPGSDYGRGVMAYAIGDMRTIPDYRRLIDKGQRHPGFREEACAVIREAPAAQWSPLGEPVPPADGGRAAAETFQALEDIQARYRDEASK